MLVKGAPGCHCMRFMGTLHLPVLFESMLYLQMPLCVGPLQWRHNDHDCVSNHQPRGCLLKRLFRHRSKKTSKLRVTGLCAGNSPGTGEFPEQMASNAENVSIWWRHHPINNHSAGNNARDYHQVSNIRPTRSQHLKNSRTVLRLSLPNPLKPDVKSRMKI